MIPFTMLEIKTQQTAPEGLIQYIKLIWVIQVEWQQRIKGFGCFLKERTVKIQVIQVVIHVFPLTMIFFFLYNKCIQYSLLKYFVVAVVPHLYRAGASAIWRREAIEQATGSLSCSLQEVLRLSSVFFLYVWVTATAKMSERKVLNVSIWTLKLVLHCCY